MKEQYELFAQAVARGENHTQAAISAGYSEKTAKSKGCQLFTIVDIKNRIDELIEEAKDETILSVKERMQILSEIAKGNPNDYIEHGADSQYISFGEESPNPRAVQSLDIYTKQDKNGEGYTTISKIKLNDAVRAINELNKMDGAHAPEKQQQVGNINLSFDGGDV